MGVKVRAYDPVAASEARRIYGERDELLLAKNAYEAAEGADALVIVTEWQEFRSPDFERLRRILKAPVIFDGRNLYDPTMVARLGFTYHAIGRGVHPAEGAQTAKKSRHPPKGAAGGE
jgi:UDPglucose 6-dehydrogenase